MRFRSCVGAVLALASCATVAGAQSLAVGDPAPRIRVSSWIRGEPTATFERDQIYVVEFWATWCIPCQRSIPHLSDVQDRFAKKNVRVIGVSIWEDRLEDVAPFVEKAGDTLRYSVAADYVPEGATTMQGHMALNWMRAAGENSIPTAFIVDGYGKVAWIGDTLSIDEPLQRIVAGTWDLDAAKAAHQKRVAVNRLSRSLSEQIKLQQWAQALHTIDSLQTLAPEREVKSAAWRFRCLLNLGREDEGYAYARKAVDGLLKDDPLALNLVAWFVVDPEAPRSKKRDLDFALRVAQRAVELTDGKEAAILDTLALIFFERGEYERAVELQEKAVKLAAGSKYLRELSSRLDQFRAKLRDVPKATQGAGGRSEGFALGR